MRNKTTRWKVLPPVHWFQENEVHVSSFGTLNFSRFNISEVYLIKYNLLDLPNEILIRYIFPYLNIADMFALWRLETKHQCLIESEICKSNRFYIPDIFPTIFNSKFSFFNLHLLLDLEYEKIFSFILQYSRSPNIEIYLTGTDEQSAVSTPPLPYSSITFLFRCKQVEDEMVKTYNFCPVQRDTINFHTVKGFNYYSFIHKSDISNFFKKVTLFAITPCTCPYKHINTIFLSKIIPDKDKHLDNSIIRQTYLKQLVPHLLAPNWEDELDTEYGDDQWTFDDNGNYYNMYN